MEKNFLAVLLVLSLLTLGCSQRSEERNKSSTEKREPATENNESLTEAGADESAGKSAIASDELLPTIRWQDAPYHIGERVFLVGQVANTGKSSSGHQFLNFGRRRNDVTGFIGRDAVAQFFRIPRGNIQR